MKKLLLLFLLSGCSTPHYLVEVKVVDKENIPLNRVVRYPRVKPFGKGEVSDGDGNILMPKTGWCYMVKDGYIPLAINSSRRRNIYVMEEDRSGKIWDASEIESLFDGERPAPWPYPPR